MPTNMTSGINPRIAQRVKILSEQDLDQIHAAALRILEKTGIRFENSQAISMFNKAGAEIEGSLVRIPAKIVEKAIHSAPSQVTLYARDPGKNLYLGQGFVHFTSGFGATWVRDTETGIVRDANLQDLVTFTRVAEALELVHMVLFAVIPQDVPSRLRDVVCTVEVMKNTTKHIQLSLESAETLDQVIKIAQTFVNKGDPLPISAGGVPNSPLHYTDDVSVKFIRLARENIPCLIVTGMMAGATSPVTLAGLLVQQTAEFLAGTVLHQLANPGAPLICGTFSGGFDMRFTKMALGGPELSLITCATQQLCDRYQIPMGYATGGMSDSPISDIQTGMEKTFGVLSAALSGVDVIHDAVSGLLGAGMVSSLAQFIVDHDMCASIKYFLEGIPISDRTLAEDLISSTGPGGNFMLSDHTVSEFRRSLFLTQLRARNLDPVKTSESGSYLMDAANKQVKKILNANQPKPISASQLAEVESLVEEARLLINKNAGG